MSIIKDDDVKGYQVGEEVFCKQCITKDELHTLQEDELILERAFDDENFCFCDRCKEQF
jgi:hypothetical protein